MVSLKHLFQSGKADGTDVTLVKPSNWNAEHKFETAAEGVVLGRAAGAGPGAVQELPITSLFFPAMIVPYAGSVAPTGWLLCQGQLLVRADYPALVAAIGGTYNIGGETAAQFRLPDLRGRVPAGIDAGAGRLPGWVAGSAGGASTSGTGAFTMSRYQNLDYGNMFFTFQAGQARVWANSVSGLAFGGGGVATQYTDAVNIDGIQGYTRVNANFTIAVDGSSPAFNIVQPTIAMNYLIKT
jgi:microcystin-dependent protein